VYQAYLQACAEGWLPQALQHLGSKVWAAWPQKYAGNDDLCLNLDCLTEHSCGRLQCTGCKVRGTQNCRAVTMMLLQYCNADHHMDASHSDLATLLFKYMLASTCTTRPCYNITDEHPGTQTVPVALLRNTAQPRHPPCHK
jgi:hypothetical protein